MGQNVSCPKIVLSRADHIERGLEEPPLVRSSNKPQHVLHREPGDANRFDVVQFSTLCGNYHYHTINNKIICLPLSWGIVLRLSAIVDKTINNTEIMASIFAEKDEFGFSRRSHIFFRRATQHVTPRNSSPSRSANAASSRRFSSLSLLFYGCIFI